MKKQKVLNKYSKYNVLYRGKVNEYLYIVLVACIFTEAIIWSSL